MATKVKKQNKPVENVVYNTRVATGERAAKEHAEAVRMFKQATKENAYAGYKSKIKLPY